MALKRFPLEQYATLELNQVAFPKTGMVVSQTPLGEKFTTDISVSRAKPGSFPKDWYGSFTDPTR